MNDLYVDADACPVKDETYRVARRYGLKVFVVCNRPIFVPVGDGIERVIVRGGFNAADDWIAEQIQAGDIAISADIPLADRCLRAGARVLGPKGDEFTPEGIGEAMAMRELMDQLRQMGVAGGGPAPFEKKDRSRFAARLDGIVQELRRHGASRKAPSDL